MSQIIVGKNDAVAHVAGELKNVVNWSLYNEAFPDGGAGWGYEANITSGSGEVSINWWGEVKLTGTAPGPITIEVYKTCAGVRVGTPYTFTIECKAAENTSNVDGTDDVNGTNGSGEATQAEIDALKSLTLSASDIGFSIRTITSNNKTELISYINSSINQIAESLKLEGYNSTLLDRVATSAKDYYKNFVNAVTYTSWKGDGAGEEHWHPTGGDQVPCDGVFKDVSFWYTRPNGQCVETSAQMGENRTGDESMLDDYVLEYAQYTHIMVSCNKTPNTYCYGINTQKIFNTFKSLLKYL